MIDWRAAAKEFRLRFKLQKERADKWFRVATQAKASREWSSRWKAEAKFLRALLDRQHEAATSGLPRSEE